MDNDILCRNVRIGLTAVFPLFPSSLLPPSDVYLYAPNLHLWAPVQIKCARVPPPLRLRVPVSLESTASV